MGCLWAGRPLIKPVLFNSRHLMTTLNYILQANRDAASIWTFLHVFFGRQHEPQRPPHPSTGSWKFLRLPSCSSGAFSSCHPAQFRHFATPLFYSNTTSNAKPVEGLGIPPTTRKASACSGKRRRLALCARPSPVSGCPQAASPGGDVTDPRQTYPISSHLRSTGTWRKWAKTARSLL